MKQIWNIFRADWKRLTASVVAVVVMLGLCLVPCLYAWFNILSNWDPYGTASTSRIKVAVASEDDGCDVLGLHVNIGELVLRGLESNDQMGWVFVDGAQTALDGVNAGDYYAALILPPEFTGDFVSILEGDLRHPQIQYYENEKKNAIAPKITSKAKTAVQEQINTTILEKVADALTTAGSVFKAMGLDGRDIADGLLEKLSAAQRDMDELAQVLRSLQDVMDGADSLLAASAITITDARSTLGDASETVGSTVRLIGSGLDAADDASADLLRVLDAADDTLSDLEDMLGAVDMGPADDTAHEKVNARIDKMIAALETARDLTSDEDVQAQLDAAISGLEELRTAVDGSGISQVQDELLATVAKVRQTLRTAAVSTNRQVSDYIHDAGERAQSSLRAVQDLLTASSGTLGSVSDTLRSYSGAVASAQPTLAAGAALAQSVSGYLADMEGDVRRVADSTAFRRFVELMESDSDSMAEYLASPVQMNTQMIYRDQGLRLRHGAVLRDAGSVRGQPADRSDGEGPCDAAGVPAVPRRPALLRTLSDLFLYGHGSGTGDGLRLPALRGHGDGGACAVRTGLLRVRSELRRHELCAGLLSGQCGSGRLRHHHGAAGGRFRRLLSHRCAASAVPAAVSLHALPLRHGYAPRDHRRHVRPHIPPLRPDPAGHVCAVHGIRPAGVLPCPQAERGHRRQQGKIRHYVTLAAEKPPSRTGRRFVPVLCGLCRLYTGVPFFYFSPLHRSYSTCITEEMVWRP